MNPLPIIRLLSCACVILGAHPAAAQNDDGTVPMESIESLQASLDLVETVLERPGAIQEGIEGIRRRVEAVAEKAIAIKAAATQGAEERMRLLQALGTRPAETEAPEPSRVETERNKLEATIAEYRGRIKSANVILARVDTLRKRLARAEFDIVARILGQRLETPLAPGLISDALSRVPRQLARFKNRIDRWWEDIEFSRRQFGTLMWWLVLLVFVVAVIVPTRTWLLHRYGPDHRDESPSFTRRFRVMLAVGFGNVVLPVVSIVGLYIVLLKSAGMTTSVREMASTSMVTLCQYFLITGLSSAALSPRFPEWRISSFTDESAIRLFRSIRLFAIVLVVVDLAGILFTEPQAAGRTAELLAMDVTRDALHTLFGAVALTVIALSMINILRPGNWQFVQVDELGQSSVASPGRLVRIFRSVTEAGLLLSAGAALVGYVNLGIFLAQRIVQSLALVAFAYLLRAFIAATCRQAVQEDSDVGALLRGKLGYSGTGATRLIFWVILAVDIVLSIAVIIALLLIWGVQAADIQATTSKLLYGINIGDYTLSLIDVGVALATFVVLFFVVRLFQGFLSNRVFAQTVPDVGVRDALTTGIGYAGIIIAAFIAISTLGLELSQLAIIFGALSVGIGFGLQHVVNNFVSGLILLMHRPIKAGDWIVVGQHEGYVKKVNVVATEIQTFDNAAVIVPNSQLVSSEVLNWTHKSTVARVVVTVGVSYESDPRQVHDILMGCAQDLDEVLRTPAPTVVFRDFGDSAMIFQLRFFIRQADYMLLTASDLRFAIADAFREAGIVIPYPQRDIHIKTPGFVGGGQGGEKRAAGASGPARADSRQRDDAMEDGDPE